MYIDFIIIIFELIKLFLDSSVKKCDRNMLEFIINTVRKAFEMYLKMKLHTIIFNT